MTQQAKSLGQAKPAFWPDVRSPSDEEIAVGADAVTTALLQALDRDIDRAQSSVRGTQSWNWLGDVTAELRQKERAEFCRRHLDAYQNVSNQEVERFESEMKLLDEAPGGDRRATELPKGLWFSNQFSNQFLSRVPAPWQHRA